ncbi:29195_t:CDS:2 [Racocetra persica]|uniref:29195_t:CDS:1 n=1 Tax=Racocetra persica TaxID=160502 RepID=A0ACA9M794_9GLOM|nr:29195_t:CDS:2 [Racocetra persica]
MLEPSMNDQFLERNIQVLGREKKSDKWTMLQDGLDDYLQALVQLDFEMVRFLLESNELQETIQPELPDANVLLMSNAKQLYFPEKLNRGNSRDCLYNDLIDLFKEKGEGWFAGSQNTRGKLFLECLSSAICVREIWASKEYWAQIIPEVFSFIAMIRKYAGHLQKSS